MRGPEMSTGAPKSDKPAPDTECPHAAAQIGRERAYLRHIRIRNLHFSNDLLQTGLASLLSWSRGRETTAGFLTNQLSRTQQLLQLFNKTLPEGGPKCATTSQNARKTMVFDFY
jgi:hypothetical protein